MDFICPKNPYVWDGDDFTPCFENMVFGFCGNLVTIVAVTMLAFIKRSTESTRNMRANHLENMFLHVVPALGACLSFYEMFLLLTNSLQGHNTEHHEWFFRCSQLFSWAAIFLVSMFDHWLLVFCNPMLCIWWILRPLLEIPHLHTVFSLAKAMPFLKECSSVFAEIMFGFFVNIIRAVRRSSPQRNFDSVEDPLLIGVTGRYKDSAFKLGSKIASCWDLLTLKFVNIMMDHGVIKQLDFEDIVQLPRELMPPSCHSTILSCWSAEQDKHHSHPSLFRAITYAYGWPYFRLGVLKVLVTRMDIFLLFAWGLLQSSSPS